MSVWNQHLEAITEVPSLGQDAFFLAMEYRGQEPADWKHQFFRLRFSLWQRAWDLPVAFSGGRFPSELTGLLPTDSIRPMRLRIYFDSNAGKTAWWVSYSPVPDIPEKGKFSLVNEKHWRVYWQHPGSKRINRVVYATEADRQDLLLGADQEIIETTIAFAVVLKNGKYFIPLTLSARVHSVGLLALLEATWVSRDWRWDTLIIDTLTENTELQLVNAVRSQFYIWTFSH